MPEFSTLLSAFVTLLVTIGPFETAPIFGGLTSGYLPAERQRIARRAVTIAGVVLLGFALSGEWILAALHVSMPALRTAGGILLFLEAVRLMLASPGLSSITDSERAEARPPRDISVFPLAMPLIAGPGSLVAILLLVGQAQGRLLHVAAVLLVLLVCLVITWATFSLADRLARILGVTGMDVVGRLSGLLLAALAMQFVFDGLREGLLAPAAS
ncbi:MAG: MarC family protein [Pseudomonadota bacterium]